MPDNKTGEMKVLQRELTLFHQLIHVKRTT